mmetsp:Transcript_74421/g.172458  ORF Transcript_74421/g.172458 Transcript_74421/m.172458 type:complete len:370 (+) Transcript_74421:108-1217(+)|eukprot:CAMPEP_0171092232 /NCGR_PEP_ID=MMETSP0766_2-20121228/35571_1 /TAXON_ID=439317 /ORGANISM="Gambierdiscus australes, Strain CAWD 149" /LENGTH=369 /DNA_ID=CAMNT_0011550443 /DNA_START=106 /DNA_END=1215 /DNA_ORIENTATION=+
MATLVVFILGFFSAAAELGDVESLLQQSLLAHGTSNSQVVSAYLQQLMANASVTESKLASKPVPLLPNDEARLGDFVKAVGPAVEPQKDVLAEGWKVFYQKASASGSSKPADLLKHAKAALLETGALVEMQKAARASSSALAKTEGAVPLDSMVVGFRTSLAPWNNVLKEFSLPLIKASFNLFSNFFGPEGNAARLCVSAAIVADSTYGVHSRWEFGGIAIFAGAAKWDNVPGWNFGASGGIDNVAYFDVSDFGWKWTLASEPETICFYFDVCVIDSEGLHRKAASALQTDSKVVSSADTAAVDIHGSTSIEHVWCSPDWSNTPLAFEDVHGTEIRVERSTDLNAKQNSNEDAELATKWDPVPEAAEAV